MVAVKLGCYLSDYNIFFSSVSLANTRQWAVDARAGTKT